jgi:hypothetical protein
VKTRFVAAFAILALLSPAAAFGDYGLTVRKREVRPGERMTLWGNACLNLPRVHLGMRVYMVAARHVRSTTAFRIPTRRPPGRPWRFLGRFRCFPDREPQPWGDGGYWTATLTFRVPLVAAGRYRLYIYCPPCRKGRGVNLIANNFYFDGQRRHGMEWLAVRR